MMKKIIIFSLSCTALLVAGCKKNDGALPKDVSVISVPVISINKEAGSTVEIVPSSSASFVGKVVVNPLYPNEAKPEKVDVVVIKNGIKTSVKVLQADVTAYPGVVTFTGPQLATLFGAPTVTCDFFDIGIDIYSKGVKYEAFPAVGSSYGSTGVLNQPNYTPQVTYNTKVEYDPAIYQGNFVVVKDGWQDTNPGDIITFTKIDANHFSFIYPTAVNPIPIVVTVDLGTLATSIAKQNIGTAWTYDPSPIPPTARTSGTPNSVAPCAKTIALKIFWGEAGTEYGPYEFTLKKQ